MRLFKRRRTGDGRGPTWHPWADRRAVEQTTLQRDAHHLLRLGAPGVQLEVDAPTGDTQLRAGCGNLARHTPVP